MHIQELWLPPQKVGFRLCRRKVPRPCSERRNVTVLAASNVTITETSPAGLFSIRDAFLLCFFAPQKGNRGRGGSERSIVVRQHRPRGGYGNGGSSDDAARRASDAALQVNLDPMTENSGSGRKRSMVEVRP